MNTKYELAVGARYHIYNSLFLNLPFRNILRTGTLLPLLQQYCEDGFADGQSAEDLLKQFFKDLAPHANKNEQLNLLFNFIQYVERQVALFDSIEDSAFEQINEVNGRGTISALLMRAKFERKENELRERLDEFGLRVVLTAHPTQFYPGHVLGILTDLEKSIRENDVPRINLLLQQLGKTGFINSTKPTPFDEAVSLCWFLENVFYQAVPGIIRSLCEGLNISVNDWKNDKLFVIGFWPGGDRDGNPFVTHEVTLQVADRLQESIFKSYYRDLRELRRRLTFRGVAEKIIKIERAIYRMAYEHDNAYKAPTELVNDLSEVRQILISEHDGLFLELLDEFILKAKLFGFHFASLDIRQDSRKHDAVWEFVLKQLSTEKKSISWEKFKTLSKKEQINYLLDLRVNPASLSLTDPLAEETIKTMLAISTIQNENGEAACHRYVISNCQSALHIIEVYTLLRLLIGKENQLRVDIVPLFETIDDLASASEIMKELYSIPVYREHVRNRGGRQTIMLGFSDGTKDGGYLRANWSIFRAKEELTRISRSNDIKAIFFDGRGGPPARGGGNTHDFYASLGETIEADQVQITIQGQTISSNFGKVASCRYNLEQLLSAGLEGPVFENEQNRLTDDQKKLLDQLADEGYKAYLDLKHDSKFVPYLERITPLSFFGDANIGSRPVKRSGGEGLKFEDLRAIPFVGSWAMMKQNIPGFYGVGRAVTALIEKGKGDALKKLYQDSLFFRTLLGNSMMSLSKTNFKATNYLGNDPEFGDFWRKMYVEYELSLQKVLEISALPSLMENSPTIKESVRLRERIVLPLVTIQQFALMNLRNLSGENKVHEQGYRKLIIRSMFGIINAARNSA
jgi:phosphoenolpyruvate carboxylase